ncbi:tRNA wybutosine-synthesizing protein 5 [Ananas comosus]|uniref:tRNA wybutosine-synthesizing protein 5 n=1 Tax=Ananas comosus TaxID=4615 RepID=A0A199VI00_ANACO|nr:tRNA wybutosine-synthesizing protein 5 [Ananas comosus]
MESAAASRLGGALRARRFDRSPSPEHFSSAIEPTNAPAERVGSVTVEAMMSDSTPVFYGDLRSHERVPLKFSTFIASCKSYLRESDAVSSSMAVQEEISKESANLSEPCSTSLSTRDQFYIAQVAISNDENKQRCPLQTLREDFLTPEFLATKSFSSINFWMNRAQSRSSTHYDPHHNLLCVVAGRKVVVLWPPSACPFLYPMPVYGEASNHSAVNIENPDYSVHYRAKHSQEYSEKIILEPGDALFIPEGCALASAKRDFETPNLLLRFHQVDSDDLTIAVNFWWKSSIMSNMLEHMDAYYLRRIVSREDWSTRKWHTSFDDINAILLVNLVSFTGQNEMLRKCSAGELGAHQSADEYSKGSKEVNTADEVVNHDGTNENPGLLQQLEPYALQVLFELISLVHEGVKVVGQETQDHAAEPTTSKDETCEQKGECERIVEENLSLLESDPIANIFLDLEPLEFRKILLAMVHHFPRTVEALVLHMLSPVGAEILTRKFDEMDQLTTKEQQDEFYKLFYSIFEDQYAVMDAILNKKELFAFQAFRNVLDQYLGAHVDRPR